ncbi:Fibrinogen-like protein A,Ryncolin-4,Fibrinogen C domain-containing protein 1-A,Tenascin-N,Angiopoietin-related protein 7,Ficolin-1-A,Ficolin-1-B,Ficolin-2,Ficolin-1,Fibrinogen C domain-containing protein 1-B,Fibrinogen C domain-containing protein 1 [Mytilus coruscus]|uniref:Fibrinogen C-terminal domain-containing protein n=1 Tax=Mytilus coruscus TaxID=42192 RepID=A0A6J8A617_MYTCO|nr:Fibrinogen-like protein A,Ryncolin-4,Fibrinogen C domain-containing protein 1-A,Tenascin-N,Angiopoietin-related protein 7,Ficolin-1-A,Ficolin-1-B,Ficolin-2,Ficolin-1,Fibrinogen C domain-containing protein 1-B,Fibrinogen C domain-containing protein 1 [Mytilus coruscus]
MQGYWKLNSMVIVFAFCLSWYMGIYVTAVLSDTKDIGNEDPLSLPLINDKGAPLVAMLDTNTINKKIQVYIKTLMRNMIQNSVQEQIQGVFRTLLEENTTKDLIRNITMQEINDVVKAQGQEKLFHPVGNEGKSKRDCTDIRKMNTKATSGVYTIFPKNQYKVKVYCDMNTDGGGWTIIQRRFDGSVNFQRNWKKYENGFGKVDGEYWLGNKHIHSLTSSGKCLATSEKYELRIDITKLSNKKKYAVYKTFVVDDAASKYKRTVGNYSGNAGNNLVYHNRMKFSTVDQDNDQYYDSCVDTWGPWWHKGCCRSGLNSKFEENMYWQYYAKTSIMMIRKL